MGLSAKGQMAARGARAQSYTLQNVVQKSEIDALRNYNAMMNDKLRKRDADKSETLLKNPDQLSVQQQSQSANQPYAQNSLTAQCQYQAEAQTNMSHKVEEPSNMEQESNYYQTGGFPQSV